MSRSTNTAESCTQCGGPAQLTFDAKRARCPSCNGDTWTPLAEWNDPTRRTDARGALVVLKPGEGNVDGMKRADVPVIVAGFLAQAEPMLEQAMAIVVTEPGQQVEITTARELRSTLQKVRLTIKKEHKEMKAGLLVQTREVDKLLRVIERIEAGEQHLLAQEQFEQRLIGQEKEARQRERVELLRPFVENPETLAFLSEMADGDFQRYLAGAETEHLAKLEREKKERAEEAERAHRDAEMMAKLRAENARLHEQTEAAERAARVIREAQEAEEQARQRAAAAPAREKLLAWATAFRALAIPEMSTAAGLEIASTMRGSVEKFAKWVEEKGLSL